MHFYFCCWVCVCVCLYLCVKVCPCVYGFKWQLKGRVKRPIWRSETWAIISLSLSMCVSVCVSMCMSDCLLLIIRVSYWPVNMLSYTHKQKLYEHLHSLTNICFAALHHRQSFHPSLKMKKNRPFIRRLGIWDWDIGELWRQRCMINEENLLYYLTINIPLIGYVPTCSSTLLSWGVGR